ncbi:hypothetical protein TVAG_341070 [Trichomonas vaginalis G3]|uniref:Protein kinase domain-containing protein n=1 Tax=Trichomonas vaginalis (strain ATCC PRA-98 / G3) TaxID=412133 RepID=A2DTR6_TRIV3|nr:peptidyl-threonine phosphorylation [Trichomonas vaginalis G3]EAY16213.1 hypothetical protein TVAG_341070 [Trichomonas vaginalis G3]KAI5493287.1 peptidyl-threonine phosphorylation [Trichomonas vaginalis G3]|eukprot:XP_001328436.1 hypothetical protein [Trichomonas vaginalis G3]
MGCGSSSAVRVAPEPEPEPILIHETEEESSSEMYFAANDQLIFTTETSPVMFNESVFMYSTLLTLDTLTLTDSPSFFNPAVKPTILEYEFQYHIGHGSASDVFLVINNKTNLKYAAKVYDPNYLDKKMVGSGVQPIDKVYNEIEIMTKINHPKR